MFEAAGSKQYGSKVRWKGGKLEWMYKHLGTNRGPSKRLVILTVLGFSSGLPLALTSGTLQAWFTQAGISVMSIGMLSLVGLPYVLKFLWAPLLDHFNLTPLGRRRSWMLISQLGLIVALTVLAFLLPAEQAVLMAVVALIIAFFSATQDVAIDAYRTELLAEKERGIGVGSAVAAYRLALIVAGAGALFIADRWGFNRAYLVMAMCMLIGVLATLSGPQVEEDYQSENLRTSLWLPLKDLLQRQNWLAILAIIVTYKLGDALAEKMATTFFLRELDFTLSELATFYKTAGISAAIIGGVVGGLCMYRFTLHFALISFALLQMLTNLGFVALSVFGKSYALAISVVIAENFFGGMGTAAFVALIMALCNRRFTATQFALLTALASLGRVFAGPIAGGLVASLGWTVFFALTVCVSVIPLVFLVVLKPQIDCLNGHD